MSMAAMVSVHAPWHVVDDYCGRVVRRGLFATFVKRRAQRLRQSRSASLPATPPTRGRADSIRRAELAPHLAGCRTRRLGERLPARPGELRFTPAGRAGSGFSTRFALKSVLRWPDHRRKLARPRCPNIAGRAGSTPRALPEGRARR